MAHTRAAPGLFLLATIAAPLAPLASAAAQLPENAREAWDETAAHWRQRTESEGVVGTSMALILNGEVVAHETRGLADVEANRSVDENTIYHWASITKTFTGISILQLRDRGLLSLDDPVVDYVPELAAVHNPFGPMEGVTLRHLLSHSAGFRGGTWPWASGADWEPHEPTDWSQLVAMMPYTQIEFSPGSRFSYSNPGIVFLGRVIEAVSGDVFEAYVEKNILRPLGMESAYFDMTPWHLLPFRSNHYFVGPNGVETGGLDFNTGITVSNGGLNASLPDMARYMAFLMGSVPDGSPAAAVLSRSSLREMWRGVVALPGETPGLGRGMMGLTYFVYEPEGRQIVGHTGTQRAFYSFFVLDPQAKVAALVAFNSGGVDGGGPDTDAIRVDVRARIVEEVFSEVVSARGR